MASLKEVKNRINSVVSTQQITKAMKMVAAAKLRRSQDRITQLRPFAQKLNAILQNLSAAQADGDSDNWYSEVREGGRILIVAVSSDRGLCGSFNSNIFKGVIRLIEEKYQAQFKAGKVTVLPIGRKAAEYFAKRNVDVVGAYSALFGNLTFDNVASAGDFVIENCKNRRFDRVAVVYNEFHNVAPQIVRAEQILPIRPAEQSNASKSQI